MTEQVTEAAAPEKEQPAKLLDFAKVDALRKHMLLTVESMAVLLSTSRVSYYNWLKHGIKRKKTSDKVHKSVRKLVAVMAKNNWPNELVYVASQAERLAMLQDMLKELDKELPE
jgi:DNA-binding transcriptional regulator YiaG